MRMVRRPDHGQGHWATAEVVHTVLPAEGLGAIPSGRLWPVGRPGRRATGTGPCARRTDAPASGLRPVGVGGGGLRVFVPAAPTRRDWARLLQDLTSQLDDGRIYDRDLLSLSGALNAVFDAYRRRTCVRDQFGPPANR